MPLIKAGLMHKGFAMIDVISPCVTFNDHEGSTKSYEFTREHYEEAVHADYIPPRQEIRVDYARGRSRCRCRCTTAAGWCCASSTRTTTRRIAARRSNICATELREGEHVTGLIFVAHNRHDMHEMNATTTCR